jgi:hypothetical protein
MSEEKYLEITDKSSDFLKFRDLPIKRLIINQAERVINSENLSKIIKSCCEELSISWLATTNLSKFQFS